MIDPPYHNANYCSIIRHLIMQNWLSDRCFIILEMHKQSSLKFLDELFDAESNVDDNVMQNDGEGRIVKDVPVFTPTPCQSPCIKLLEERFYGKNKIAILQYDRSLV
jgi:hypothetical protein